MTHPNEMLVKENGHREYVKPDPIGRRDYMKALALAGGTVLAGSALTAEEAMAAVADGSPKIEFGDAASDPAANGVMARNGTDVKVFSGGAVRNLTNVGSGSSTLSDSSATNAGGHTLYELPNDGEGILLNGASNDGGLLFFDADGDNDTYFGLEDDFNQINLTVKGTKLIQTAGAVPSITFVNETINLGSGVNLNVDGETVNYGSGNFENLDYGAFDVQDVRNISGPSQGWVAYHDGSGTNTEGLAAYNGTNWISQVDGSTIS